jgi:hypothetical protein
MAHADLYQKERLDEIGGTFQAHPASARRTDWA